MTYADAFNIRTVNVKFNDVADAVDGVISREWGGTTTGASNVYSCTPSPSRSAYAAGEVVRFTPHQTNTAAATFAYNGLAATAVRYCNAALVGGEIVQDVEAFVQYDGTYMNLLNHGGGWASWTPTYGAGGSMTYTSVTTNVGVYQRHGSRVDFMLSATGTTGGTASTSLTFTAPVAASGEQGSLTCFINENGSFYGGTAVFSSSTTVAVRKYDTSNFSLGVSRSVVVSGHYRV